MVHPLRVRDRRAAGTTLVPTLPTVGSLTGGGAPWPSPDSALSFSA
jgi:hypothetical protein